MSKPLTGFYYDNYIQLVAEEELMDAFHQQQSIIDNYFEGITEEQSNHAYAPGKWTPKELLQHIIDCERIFSYRALSIARKETASLPGFDENEYAAASEAHLRTWKSLCEELKAVRRSSLYLFESFQEGQLNTVGLANDKLLSVRAIGFILIGHLIHHKNILEERYLVK